MNLSVGPSNLYATPPIEFVPAPGVRIPLQASSQSNSASGSGSGSGSGATATVSQEGQFLSNLQNLQSTQPQQVQAAFSQAATGLTAAAQQAGITTPQGQFLSNSAAQLQQVANGGGVSALQPPAATNAVEQTYRPNEIGGGQGVLSLIRRGHHSHAAHGDSNSAAAGSSSQTTSAAGNSSATQASSSSTPAATIPDLFGGNSGVLSNGSNVQQSVSDVLNQLQKALSL